MARTKVIDQPGVAELVAKSEAAATKLALSKSKAALKNTLYAALETGLDKPVAKVLKDYVKTVTTALAA